MHKSAIEGTNMCTGPHPFIPAPKVAKLQIILLNDGQRTENVLHFVKSAGWDLSGLIALAASVIGNWTSTVGLVTSTQAQLLTVIADNMAVEAGEHYEVTPTSPIMGGDSAAPLPNNCSFKLRFGTGLRGKSYRGGIYHSGMTEAFVTKSELASVKATAIRDAWDNLTSQMAHDSSSNLGIVSYCHARVWRTTAIASNVVSIDYADLVVDSQRRRLPGRGS